MRAEAASRVTLECRDSRGSDLVDELPSPWGEWKMHCSPGCRWGPNEGGEAARVALRLFLPHASWLYFFAEDFKDLLSSCYSLWSVIKRTISREEARNSRTPAPDRCPAMAKTLPRRDQLSEPPAGI